MVALGICQHNIRLEARVESWVLWTTGPLKPFPQWHKGRNHRVLLPQQLMFEMDSAIICAWHHISFILAFIYFPCAYWSVWYCWTLNPAIDILPAVFIKELALKARWLESNQCIYRTFVLNQCFFSNPYLSEGWSWTVQRTTTPPSSKSSLSSSSALLNCQSLMSNLLLNLLSGLAGHLSPALPLIMNLSPLFKSENIPQFNLPGLTKR